MRHPQTNPQGRLFAREHFSQFPRPDQAANDALQRWINGRGLNLDPREVEVVTLHYQRSRKHGWQGVVVQKLGLAEAMLSNWQGESDNDWLDALIRHPWGGTLPGRITLVDALRPPAWNKPGSGYAVYNGLFRRSEPQEYSPQTRIDIPIESLQAFIWDLDFHATYRQQLEQYWTSAHTGHRTLAKAAFITACNQQVSEGSLDEPGRRLAWQAAGLLPRQAGFRARPLNIYGYAATDLICIEDGQSPQMLLYIPGNSSPLHTFVDEAAMKQWIGEQCRRPEVRQALARHFALADLPDGLDFSGLRTALEGLAAYPAIHPLAPDRPGFTTDGRWPPATYVNYHPDTYSPVLQGELFAALSERQRLRSLADADTLITTRSDVRKTQWREYLACTTNLLAPLTVLVPELGLLYAATSLAQFGLALDQVIHGKTLTEQAENVEVATYGLLNAQPLVLDGARKASALFRAHAPEFVVPGRFNGRLGYRLSPQDPPRLPEDPALAYFHIPEDITPLRDCDAATAGAIIRTPRFDGRADMLRASVDGYLTDVVYDLDNDAFYRAMDLNEIDPPGFVAQAGRRALSPVPSSRQASHQTRMANLRALGVDLHLPVAIPAPLPESSLREIPKHAMNIWLGDKLLARELLANIANNAERLGEADWEYRFYLSRAWPEAFAENRRLLQQWAPSLKVLPLEDQPVYHSFTRSKLFPQYQAALDGNKGVARNFSSASDDVRYHLLYEEGGLYMDVDDTLLKEGLHPLVIDGVRHDFHAESLRKLALKTTPDGLLLHPPVSNELLGMHIQFNGSLVGSHPGNPTLLAIMDEMHERYQTMPDFYDHRPDRALDPAAFHRYSADLNRLTGPAMLTDVVMRQLPALRVLRELNNFYGMPNFNAVALIDQQAFERAQQHYLPLNRIARIGSNNSWVNT